jgi:hypothetical protein
VSGWTSLAQGSWGRREDPHQFAVQRRRSSLAEKAIGARGSTFRRQAGRYANPSILAAEEEPEEEAKS